MKAAAQSSLRSERHAIAHKKRRPLAYAQGRRFSVGLQDRNQLLSLVSILMP
jgi:hypothetical protein